MMLSIRHHDVNLADWWAFVSTDLRKRDGCEGGHSIAWPSGQDMGADRVWEICLEQNGHEDAADFLRWPWRNSLSLSGAAKALDISRRIVAYYRSGCNPCGPTCLRWLGSRAEKQGNSCALNRPVTLAASKYSSSVARPFPHEAQRSRSDELDGNMSVCRCGTSWRLRSQRIGLATYSTIT